jgi:hypothetical protein
MMNHTDVRRAVRHALRTARPDQRVKVADHLLRGGLVRIASSMVVIALFVPIAAPGQTWDPAPFRSATPIPRDGLPPERAAFFTWFGRNSASLSQPDVQRVHERLYAYISELAKRQAGRFPALTDSVAFNLFRAAASVGVTGADRVARALYPYPERLPPPAEIPGFTLSLHPPLFSLASDDGSWGVCYPYYFMADPRGRQRGLNGVLTEVVILSTLFAPDRGEPGSSQATIILAAAQVADSARHVSTWLRQFGFSPTVSPTEDPSGVWYAGPTADPVRRIGVVRRLRDRVIVIAYLGLGGTFESNRPHFFDVLQTIASGRCAAA